MITHARPLTGRDCSCPAAKNHAQEIYWGVTLQVHCRDGAASGPVDVSTTIKDTLCPERTRMDTPQNGCCRGEPSKNLDTPTMRHGMHNGVASKTCGRVGPTSVQFERVVA